MSADQNKPEVPATARYVIRSGASFRLHDGTVLTGGQEIELPSDVAAQHADKLGPQPMPLDEAPAPAPSADA